MPQWGNPIMIRNLKISSSIFKNLYDLLVFFGSITQYDCLHQTCPSQVVYMVYRVLFCVNQ